MEDGNRRYRYRGQSDLIQVHWKERARRAWRLQTDIYESDSGTGCGNAGEVSTLWHSRALKSTVDMDGHDSGGDSRCGDSSDGDSGVAGRFSRQLVRQPAWESNQSQKAYSDRESNTREWGSHRAIKLSRIQPYDAHSRKL